VRWRPARPRVPRAQSKPHPQAERLPAIDPDCAAVHAVNRRPRTSRQAVRGAGGPPRRSGWHATEALVGARAAPRPVAAVPTSAVRPWRSRVGPVPSALRRPSRVARRRPRARWPMPKRSLGGLAASAEHAAASHGGNGGSSVPFGGAGAPREVQHHRACAGRAWAHARVSTNHTAGSAGSPHGPARCRAAGVSPERSGARGASR
jgi:hypothetical protein